MSHVVNNFPGIDLNAMWDRYEVLKGEPMPICLVLASLFRL